MRTRPVAVVIASLVMAMTPAAPAVGQGPEPTASSPAVAAENPEPTRCLRSRLTEVDYRAIAQQVIEALWEYYATGDAGVLTPVATPNGLDSLGAIDWRFRAVRDGLVRFEEEPSIVEINDWVEWCLDDQRVAIDIEPIIEIGSGAFTLDGARGKRIEAVEGEQRRAFVIGLVPVDDGAGWLVDEVRLPDHRPNYVQPRPARPCPGLGDPSRVRDPFLMRPWCDANGEGRMIPPWRGRPGGELGIGTPDCWPGAHQVLLGLPPGTPLDRGAVGTYVRDPQGTVPGARGFRRRFTPPADAISTGITNGYATIWTSEALGDDWLIVRVGRRFERWPAHGGACPAN